MNPDDIEIIKYTSEYKRDLIELLKHLWLTKNYIERERKFEWRYENNPYTVEPLIYLALYGEKVIGFRAFVVQKFIFNVSKSINVLSPADAIVLNEYRRSGIFSMLNTALLKEMSNSLYMNSLILNLSSNRYSTPGYIKQKWQATNGIKRHCFKFSLFSFLCFVFKNTRPNKNILLNKRNTCIELSDKLLIDELVLFNDINRDANKISNIHDKNYFSWRYPGINEKHLFVYYRINNKLVGYLIVLRVSDIQYSILEYSANSNRIVKQMIEKLMNHNRIPVLRSWVLSEKDKKELKKCGFYFEPVRILQFFGKKRLPVLVRPVIITDSNNDFFIDDMDIRDINNWQVYLADKH